MENEINASQNNTQNKNIETRETKYSFGPVMGIIIIVALLVLGGFYIWGSTIKNARLQAIQEKQEQEARININEVPDATPEEYIMTEEEFNALIDNTSPNPNTVPETLIESTLDDLEDLDALDAELETLELEL